MANTRLSPMKLEKTGKALYLLYRKEPFDRPLSVQYLNIVKY